MGKNDNGLKKRINTRNDDENNQVNELPDSLAKFIASLPQDEQKIQLQRIKSMTKSELEEMDKRRRWILNKYPHAFTTGLSLVERMDVEESLGLDQPLCSMSTKLLLLMVVVCLFVYGFAEYFVNGRNMLVYVDQGLSYLLKP